jgi:rhodanese-related sulfurtransferase
VGAPIWAPAEWRLASAAVDGIGSHGDPAVARALAQGALDVARERSRAAAGRVEDLRQAGRATRAAVEAEVERAAQEVRVERPVGELPPGVAVMAAGDVVRAMEAGDRLLLLDVRTAPAGGRPRGAISLPARAVTADRVPSGWTPVLCGVATDSEDVVAAARALTGSAAEVAVLEGGAAAWAAAGLPIDGGAAGVRGGDPGFVSAADLREMLASASPPVVCDARDPELRRRGSLPSAVPCEQSAVGDASDEPRPIVIVASSDEAARAVGRRLLARGPGPALVLEGGLRGWVAAGGSVSR